MDELLLLSCMCFTCKDLIKCSGFLPINVYDFNIKLSLSGDAGLQSVLSSMDPNQLVQLLSGTGLGESSSRPTSVASNAG